MIHYATQADLPVLKKIWTLCFPEDTPEFVRFYFNTVFHCEETPVFYNNGIPVAALQLIPYQIKLGNINYPAIYISGAMTHPNYQNRGLMKQLLLFSFEEMKKQGIPLSFLIPQTKELTTFYAKYDYIPAFQTTVQQVSIELNQNTPVVKCHMPHKLVSIYPHYYAFLSQQQNVVLKTSSQFETLLYDLYLENGLVFTIDSGKNGIAFVIPKKERIVIKELFSDSEETKKHLIAYIHNTFNHKPITLISHNMDTKNEKSFGMIKILDHTIFSNSLPPIYMSMMLD